MSTCQDALNGMGLTEANAASKLLPSTLEWSLQHALADSVELRNPNGDVSKCELLIHVKRNAMVFVVKQIAISILVVLCGLCALFLHAGDHTGDRVALILVSALICTTSFQTDLGLGPIPYLLWFDVRRLDTSPHQPAESHAESHSENSSDASRSQHTHTHTHTHTHRRDHSHSHAPCALRATFALIRVLLSVYAPLRVFSTGTSPNSQSSSRASGWFCTSIASMSPTGRTGKRPRRLEPPSY